MSDNLRQTMEIVKLISSFIPKGVRIRTSKGRFYLQRGVYLLSILGNKLCQKYNYGTYFYGPFSKELDEDLDKIFKKYDIKKKNIKKNIKKELDISGSEID